MIAQVEVIDMMMGLKCLDIYDILQVSFEDHGFQVM